mgnify:FL=1
MASYLEEIKGKNIVDIKDNPEFQDDLVRFLTSSRKDWSFNELADKDVDWMIDEYVEHMRSQDANEATALMDLSFAKDETANEKNRVAFGRLMMAWDNSEGVGTGYAKGTGDYLEALATSPATLAAVFTGGYSKVGAIVASKGVQIAARSALAKLLSREGGKQALKGFVAGAGVETAAATAQVEMQEGARENTIDGYEGMSATEKALTIGMSGAFGGGVGSLARVIDARSASKVGETLLEQSVEIAKSKAAKAKLAVNALKTTRQTKPGAERVDRILNRMSSLTEILIQRQSKINKKNPLDPKKVAEGLDIKETILTDGADINIGAGLSRHTLQGITGAALEISEQIELQPGERITSAVTRALANTDSKGPSITTTRIDEIINNYGLSREEFSYIFLSDLSEAGKTLGEAGQLSRAITKNIFGDIESLADRGVSLFNEGLARQVADTVGVERGYLGSLVDLAKGLDSVRIAFMTSQLGTTAANAMFSTARVGIDVVDQVFRQTLRVGTGVVTGERVPLSSFHAVTSTIRGMSINRKDATLLQGMFQRDLPEEYGKIFRDASRIDMAVDTTTRLGRIGNAVNLLNSAVDSRFKQAAFYSSVDRQMIEQGTTLNAWLKNNNSLLDLPTNIREKAVYDSLDFVFQKGYKKSDGVGPAIANSVIRLSKEAPFIVTGVMGMPFPRYVANHMEFINDYTPLALITGGKKNFDSIYAGPMKDPTTRWARQLTGISIFSGAVYARASQVEFDDDGKAVGMKTSFGDMQVGEEGEVSRLGRVAGPIAAHMLLADLYVRWKYDLPVPKKSEIAIDALEVGGGLGNMGLDSGLITDIRNAADNGEWGQGLNKRFADIGATFTYPTTVLRDLQGNLDPELSYVPYTRSLMMGDEDNERANLLDIMMADSEAFNRLVRMLPETTLTQYTQSLNGKTAPALYNPFSGGPERAVNPMTKQVFGVERKVTQTGIQKAMVTLGMKEYMLYNRGSVKNPSMDLLVRKGLADYLPEEFERWRSEPLKIQGVSITWDDLNPELQRDQLKKFIRKNITLVSDRVEAYFEELKAIKPKLAAGYIRNAYVIQEKSSPASYFQSAAKSLSGEAFDNADEYIADSDSIEEELYRRNEILRVVGLAEDAMSANN